MVAADSRFDYLSSTYRPRRNELHGVLKALNLKEASIVNTIWGFFVLNNRVLFCISPDFHYLCTKLDNLKSMNENKNEQQGLQLELPQDVAQGEYANFAIITHSSSDFIVDFARVMPGLPKAQVKSRVILAPEHAKRLLGALQENIMRYEKEFGPIRIPNQEPRTAKPFDLPQGEA